MSRVLPLTRFVSVADVLEAVGCSRSKAFALLRDCAVRYGLRKPEQRGMLRVSLNVWERYTADVLGWNESSGGATRTAGPKVPGTPGTTNPVANAASALPASKTARRPR